MAVVHRLFRRESGLLPRIVRAVPDGALASAQRTGAAVTEYIGGLHHHHAVEDDLIWPLLRARAADSAALAAKMESQHAEIDASLLAVTTALAAWSDASGAAGTALADALDAHRESLLRHLDDEEELLLPLVAEHLTQAEWDEVGRRGLETVPRNKVLLVLGAILEDATPDEQAYFLAKAPAVGRLMWRLFGRRQYAASCRALRAPLAAAEPVSG